MPLLAFHLKTYKKKRKEKAIHLKRVLVFARTIVGCSVDSPRCIGHRIELVLRLLVMLHYKYTSS